MVVIGDVEGLPLGGGEGVVLPVEGDETLVVHQIHSGPRHCRGVESVAPLQGGLRFCTQRMLATLLYLKLIWLVFSLQTGIGKYFERHSFATASHLSNGSISAKLS